MAVWGQFGPWDSMRDVFHSLMPHEFLPARSLVKVKVDSMLPEQRPLKDLSAIRILASIVDGAGLTALPPSLTPSAAVGAIRRRANCPVRHRPNCQRDAAAALAEAEVAEVAEAAAPPAESPRGGAGVAGSPRGGAEVAAAGSPRGGAGVAAAPPSRCAAAQPAPRRNTTRRVAQIRQPS